MLEKITEAEINERSMARVSNTPGRRTAFGQSEMDAEALKLRFDRLGRFLAGKINEILGSLEDGSIAEYIYIDHNGDKISVEQFITNLLNGDVDNIQIKTGYGIVYLTEIAMKTEEMYNGQFTGDSANQLYIVDGVTLRSFYEEFKQLEENGVGGGDGGAVKSVNGKTGEVELNAEDVGARPDTWMPSADDVRAEPAGTAAAAVETHNNDGESHQDIRRELKDLTDQMANAGAVKSVNSKTGDVELNAEDVGARPDTWMPSAADVGARPNTWTPTAEEVGARPDTWTPSYSDVGADKSGTAESKVSAHNVSEGSHNDIRLLIQGLADRINAIANSTDVDLDDFKEVVAYIKANRGLIDAITTNKINYTDIINDLVTNVTNKPLSAAQGVALKLLIDNLTNNKLDASALTSAINTALAQAKASGEFNGAQGIQGYNIVASVDRPSFTTANWDTYGTVGREENWGGTSNAGVRVGDIFIIVGTATDTGIGHMLVYKYTGEKGGNTLSGQCLAHHIVAYRGAGGAAGTSVTVSSVSESTASGGTNVVNFSDGKKVSIKNGTNGKDGTNYVLTDADRTQIANIVTTQLGGQPVYGVVDANKVVTLRGTLELDDTYTFGYIKNGEFIEIGKGEYVPDDTPPYTNLADTSTWVYDKRLSGSSGEPKDGETHAGYVIVNFIPAKMGDVLRVKGMNLKKKVGSDHFYICAYNGSKTFQKLASVFTISTASNDGALNCVSVDGDISTYTIMMQDDGEQRANESTQYVKFAGSLLAGYTAEDVIITINEEIV